MKNAAIVIIAYNKPDSLLSTFNNLLKADYIKQDADLVVSIDYSGNDDVENVARSLLWPHGELIIRTFKEHQGLKKHILQCFEYAEHYNVVFLIEDDIYLSESYFKYGYNAAKFYEDDENIAGISLYNFEGNWQNWAFRFEPLNNGSDAYFLKLAQSWGEVVTTNQWLRFKKWYQENEIFEKDENNVESINKWPDSSWLKYFDRYCFLNDKYFVYPYVSLATNTNGTGVHNKKTVNDYQTILQGKKDTYKFVKFEYGNPELPCYDEYFNPMWIEEKLGYSMDNLTIDLWCTKRKSLFKEYVLTGGYYGKNYIKSYSLSLHPIELSLLNDVKGKGLYIYKSSIIASKKPNKYDLLNYSLRTSDWRRVKFFGTRLFFKTYSGLIKKKLSKK